MSDKSAIEWTDASWNPIRSTTGRHYCEKISAGCDNCYASTMTRRLAGHAYPRVGDAGEPGRKVNGVTPELDEFTLNVPIAWRQPRRIFVCSMTDLFGEWVPDSWIDAVFRVMAATPRHSYQVLTKRPARMHAAIERLGIGHGLAPLFADSWPLPNVWLGVSVESDAYTWRAKVLAEIPAAVRFISAEPLLGPLPSLKLTARTEIPLPEWPVEALESGAQRCFKVTRPISWLITGGESGAGARPMHPDWARDLRDRCQAAGVAYFHKQNGEWAFDVDMAAYGVNAERWIRVGKKASGRLLDGRTWDEFPAVPAVR